MLKRFSFVSIVLAVSMSFSSCASIINGSKQKITFNSTPSGASITVLNDKKEEVFTGMTPSFAQLKRGKGYFKSAEYTVIVEKKGYGRQKIHLSSSISGWSFGNILVGGLIGLLIVDPISGGMWKLEPKEIDHTFESVALKKGERALFIALKEDVPKKLADKLIKIQ